MKAFIKKLGEMFLDKNGKVSYKRIVGAVCAVNAIIISWITADLALAGLFLAPGVASAGLSLGEKKDAE